MSTTHPLVIKALRRNFNSYNNAEDAITEVKGWSNSALKELFTQMGIGITDKGIMIATLEDMLRNNWESLKP